MKPYFVQGVALHLFFALEAYGEVNRRPRCLGVPYAMTDGAHFSRARGAGRRRGSRRIAARGSTGGSQGRRGEPQRTRGGRSRRRCGIEVHAGRTSTPSGAFWRWMRSARRAARTRRESCRRRASRWGRSRCNPQSPSHAVARETIFRKKREPGPPVPT